VPSLRNVVRAVVSRSADFLREAGRLILVATVVLWALLSFPRPPGDPLGGPDLPDDGARAAQRLEASVAGRLGHAIEPAIAPLGFDWKTGVGLIGAFAAREVFVSTMGVVYGISDAAEDDAGLRDQMRADLRPDGTPVWTPLTGMSVMVFFALSMQCLSTLAVLRKETGGWRWPAFVTVAMTTLAWVVSFAVYQGGRLLGLS
jgi:ferrous iron transport protein B